VTSPAVVHIVDRHTPLDLVHQLNVLAGPADKVVSVGRPPWPRRLGPEVHTVHIPMGLVHRTVQRLRSRFGRPEVVHCWSIRALGAASALAGLFRAGFVLSLACVPDQKRHRLEIRGMMAQSNLRLTVPTAAAKADLTTRGAADSDAEGLNPERIDILAPPAEPNLDHRIRDEARRKLGLSDEDFVLIAPGEAVRDARHERIAWAQGIIARLGLNIHLLLCDPGRYLTFTLNRQQMTGAEHPPRSTAGVVSRGQALAAADLAVFAQRRDVGCEAMAAAMGAGTACLAAPTRDAVDLLGPPRAAARYLTSAQPRALAADILHLAESPDELASMGLAAGKRFASRHSPASTAQVLGDAYRDSREALAVEPSSRRGL
jgi:glycosyltransferase involved in cell wall biosynthesis